MKETSSSLSTYTNVMERIRSAIKQRRSSPAYEPLDDGSGDGRSQRTNKQRFSWLEYSIFLLLGISMLWAWNMFLAASPYFQHRFAPSSQLLSAYSPTLLSVSTVTNLVSMLILTHLQSNAHYPHRITLALFLNIITFTLLALSTVMFRGVSGGVYFGFLMTMVFLASLATGLCQNGVFAFVSGFGVAEYTQAIMTGQAVAGVLPCIAQIISVLSVPVEDSKTIQGQEKRAVPQQSGISAFAYFLTATAISIAAVLAFFVLLRRHPNAGAVVINQPHLSDTESPSNDGPPIRKVVSLWTLYRKFHWLANAVFVTFAITMTFPVFTQQITSVHPPDTAPRILHPACFIPLAFLFWNTGDLAGRLLPLLPRFAALVRWPRTIFLLSIARIIWIPLYLLCNIDRNRSSGGVSGEGAIVSSDFFYLVIVQFLFGLSNGFLGSSCMIGAVVWVDQEEREAAGGFMGLLLVAGLTVGSLLSFLVA